MNIFFRDFSVVLQITTTQKIWNQRIMEYQFFLFRMLSYFLKVEQILTLSSMTILLQVSTNVRNWELEL